MRGKKNLGLWWIRAVRCFQVSFVFVLLPVRFFVFPATGNSAPVHMVSIVHGYHHRLCPSLDVITVLSLLSITVMQTATAHRLPKPFTPSCNWSACGDTACPTLLVNWLLQLGPTVQVHWFASNLPHPAPPVLFCFILLILDGGFPALPVLIDQPGSLTCYLDLWYASLLSQPGFHSSFTLLSLSWTWPLCSVIIISHCHGTLIHLHQSPTILYNTICLRFSSYSWSLLHFILPYTVLYLTPDPHGSKHHGLSDSPTLYNHKKTELISLNVDRTQEEPEK